MKVKNSMFAKLIETNLKSIYRQKMAFFFTIIFPLIFVAVFGISYSGNGISAQTMEIIVINQDSGIPDGTIAFYGDAVVSGTFYSEKYLEILDELTYPDSKDNATLFSITIMNQTDIDQALFKLERREIVALITLPESFSQGILSTFKISYDNNTDLTLATNNWYGYPETTSKVSVTVEGDASLQEFAVTGTIIREFTEMFFNFGKEEQTTGVETVIVGNYATKGFTAFHYVIPGVIVFGILQSLTSATGVTMRDVESKSIERIRLTSVQPRTYILSLIFSQALLVSVQVPIMFSVSMMFGLEPSINILIGILIGIILSIGITGIAFLLAGLAGGSKDAEGLANLVAVPMAFLSGAFTIIPNPEIVSNISWLGGNSFRLFDFLPSTPAIRALRSIILGQRTIGENWFDLALLVVLSLIYLGLGLTIYSRKHLRPK